MSINVDELLGLTYEEKLRIYELLREDLEKDSEEPPIPDHVRKEALRRKKEMEDDPNCGITYEELWRRVEERHSKSLPLTQEIIDELDRREKEMDDPANRLSHEEVWQRFRPEGNS